MVRSLASKGSLRLDARELDHLGPLLGFVGDEFSEVDGCTGKCNAAQSDELLLDFRIDKSRIDLLIEQVDDLGGSVLRCADAIPDTCLKARYELTYGWKVWKCFRASRCGHCQRTHFASPDVLDRCNRGDKVKLNLAGDGISNCRRAAAIRDMNHIDARHHLEKLGAQVGRAPVADRRVVDLTWIGFGIGNELRNRFRWNRWVDCHNKRPAEDGRHRRDVADEIKIEFVFLVERGVHRVCRTYRHERVTVGCRK